MFHEYTEEYLMDQAREMGQELGVDTRQGSVYMDACTGHIMRVAKFYEDLRTTFDMLSDENCTGEVLEEKAAQRQIHRKMETPSYYEAVFEGVEASEMTGDRFMVDGYYFILVLYDGGYYLQSETLGSETNYILPGKNLIPVKNTMGLVAAVIGDLYISGTDREADDSLRKRYLDVLAHPSENGNKQQYKNWCEEYEGVGRAVITPLGRGANTVTALIISSQGIAPTAALISQIQEDIDPGSEGLGEGKAPIGCHFYAIAAEEVLINISFLAEIAVGYTKESALSLARKELSAYLKEIALNTPEDEYVMVQYVKIVGILADIPAIKDFSELKINGTSDNIIVSKDGVSVLGEVVIQ